MTVLVAVHDRAGGWAIGADSTTWDGPLAMAPLPDQHLKIQRRPDDVIVAVSGNYALAPLLDRALDEAAGDRFTDTWAQAVADRWAELGRDRHLLDDDTFDGQAFLAHGDDCWDLSEHLAMRLGCWGVYGAGREVAAGALHVLSRLDLPASDIARRAVEAAIAIHRDCGRHATVHTTTTTGDAR